MSVPLITLTHHLALCQFQSCEQRGRAGLRQTEVDDPRHRFAVDFHYQNVGRLKVAVNDRFLVGVL